MKRYQECNILEKFWRRRWLLLIPFIFIFKYLKGVRVYLDEIKDNKLEHTDKYEFANYKLIWRLSHSEATMRMKWYHTHYEVISKIKNKIKNKYSC